MTDTPARGTNETWRVVVFTIVPDGRVFHSVEQVLKPLGHRVVGVVTTPGPPKRRSASYLSVVAAVRPGIDVIVANHPSRIAAMIAPLRPDLIISAGFPYLIPPDVVALPRLGAINIHPALLPKYRGPKALEWAFRNGDPKLGITIHRIANDFDTGPILAQTSVPIGPDDVLGTVLPKLDNAIPKLLSRALERVAHGDPGDPQDESQASYAGKFEPEWTFIDWSQPARVIHNQVRSLLSPFDPDASAIGTIGGEELRITRTCLPEWGTTGGGDVMPGTVIARNSDRISVQCGDGPIDVLGWSACTS
jgi:methionyl-tRNA formyltransferase